MLEVLHVTSQLSFVHSRARVYRSLRSIGLSGLQVWASASSQQMGQDSHPPGLWLRGGDLPHCSPLEGLSGHPQDRALSGISCGSAKTAPMVSLARGHCQADPQVQVSSVFLTCAHHSPLAESSSPSKNQNTKLRTTHISLSKQAKCFWFFGVFLCVCGFRFAFFFYCCLF